MAVSHNVAASAAINHTTNIATVTPTVVAGSNRTAIIGISYDTHFNEIDPTALVSVTWDGVAATFIQLVENGSTIVEQYYVTETTHNLATGSHTVLATFTGGRAIGIMGVEVLNDAGQSPVIGQKNTNVGTGTAVSVAVASTTTGSMVVDTFGEHNPTSTSATVGALQTSRWNSQDTFTVISTDRLRAGGSTEPSPAGGTITMSWTLSAIRIWATTASEVLIFVAPPVPPRTGVWTSYEVGRFDVSDPHSEVLPEIAQRIWAGDRRFQGG